MLDAMTIALVVGIALVLVLLFLIYQYATRETSFEEAYGESARKLLAADERAKKAKSGGVKKGKVNGAGKEKRDEEKGEETNVVGENESAGKGSERYRNAKQRRTDDSGDALHRISTASEPDDDDLPGHAKPGDHADPESLDSTNHGAGKKEKKKKKAVRDDGGIVKSHVESVVNPAQSDDHVIEQSTKTTSQIAKKKGPPYKSLKIEDVLSRLANSELEPEYVDFLRDHLHKSTHHHLQLTKHAEDIAQLQKALSEKEQQANAAVRFSDLELSKLKSSLTEQMQKYAMLETTSRSQLVGSQQLAAKLQTQLHTMQNDVKRVDAERLAFKTQLEQLRTQMADTARNAAKSGDLEQRYQTAINDIKVRDGKLRALEDAKKSCDDRIASLVAQVATFEEKDKTWTKMREQITALQADIAQLETANRALKAEKVTIDQHEKTTNTQQTSEEMVALREQLASATRENESLMASGKDAEQRVHAVEEGKKKELEAMREAMEKMKKENRDLADRHAKFESSKIAESTQRDDLQRQLDALRMELDAKKREVEKLNATIAERDGQIAMKVKENAIESQRDMNRLQEEMNGIKKIVLAKDDEIRSLKAELGKAQSTAQAALREEESTPGDTGDVTELKAQVEDEKRRNNELREKNYKMLEAITAMEQTSKQMVKAVEEKYEKLLKEHAGTSTSPRSPDPGQHPAKKVGFMSPAPVSTTERSSSTCDDELRDLRDGISHYEYALNAVSMDLDRIQQTAIERERVCEERIAQLELQLEKARDGEKKAQEQLQHFLQTDKIESLRAELASEHATGRAVIPAKEKLRALPVTAMRQHNGNHGNKPGEESGDIAGNKQMPDSYPPLDGAHAHATMTGGHA